MKQIKIISTDKQPVYTKIKSVILLLFLISMGSTIQSQTIMLINQIEGRAITRNNFNEKGIFLNKQTFKAEKLTSKDGYYEVKVVTELFDKNKKSTDKYTTIYRCKPSETSIVVMAFPFSKPRSKETEVRTNSKNFKDLYDLQNLKNIELEMTFASGLLNFFGSKSIIKVFDRKLGNDRMTIQSKINITAYTLGLLIKQLNYTVKEKLNKNGLLTFQQFTEADGSYFIMNYN